jgi:hypothetical protein
MQNKITRKQLRSFGFTVGGIFALIALWPLIIRADNPRWWAVVVAGCLLVPRRRLSQELGVGLQRVDGARPCAGLDQHENYSRTHLLFCCDPDRNRQTMAGQGSHGQKSCDLTLTATVSLAHPGRRHI